MKSGGILLLALLGALLAAAFMGPASAAAVTTEICKVNSSPNSCGSFVYASGTIFGGNGSANLGVTSCNSAIKFETGATIGSPTLPTTIASLTFSSCTNGCSVTQLGSSWKMPIEVSGSGPHGTAKISNSSGLQPELEVTGCESHCVYKGTIPEFITGGTIAIFKSSGGSLINQSGSSCAASLSPSMVHEVPGLGGNGFFVTI